MLMSGWLFGFSTFWGVAEWFWFFACFPKLIIKDTPWPFIS